MAKAALGHIDGVARLSAAGFSGSFKRECADIARRVAPLAHLLEEILEFPAVSGVAELESALRAAKRLLTAAGNYVPKNNSSDGAAKKIAFQFQCVTWKLERALGSLTYDEFDISEEVQEQVGLVRSQLKRAIERYGGPVALRSTLMSRALSQPRGNEINLPARREMGILHVENIGNIDSAAKVKENRANKGNNSQVEIMNRENQEAERLGEKAKDGSDQAIKDPVAENKTPESPVIPSDFLCPISLELMKDPIIVATGQTYERSYIQRWIDCGNTTCPKTQQNLQNFILTPNYALKNLINQWCTEHNVEEPTPLMNGRIRRSDGSFHDVSGDIALIQTLVHNLSYGSTEDIREAVAEIRSLSKRNTDNRLLIAEVGAIPILVNLLTSDDALTQENAVTSILNLSIYENNKGLIMLANAVPSIVQVLKTGTMEARENSAATLFSLSIVDENKIIIGASGAIPALIDLLDNGSIRGKKDAATALFNLCIYHGNRGRAVRDGIVISLVKMLIDDSYSMVDEALTILSVLASHHEAKIAIVKASTIPILIDILRMGLARNKENASAILLSLCKRDGENLACIGRLGAVVTLAELARSGTERAKRKATSLLELLRKSR